MQRTPLAQKSNKSKTYNMQPPARSTRARGAENTPVGQQGADKGPTAPQPVRQPPPPTPVTRPTPATPARRNGGTQPQAPPQVNATNATQQATSETTVGEEEEDEEEEEQSMIFKRNRNTQFARYEATLTTDDLNALFKIGRLGGRLCVPFSKYEQVFHFGATFDVPAQDPTQGPGKFNFNLAHRCAWEWKTIKEAFPALQGLVDRLDKNYLIWKLNFYRGATRGEDALRIKTLAPDLHAWTPAIPRAQMHDKSMRGFRNPQMAQMLLPVTEDFNNPATAHAYLTGAKKLSALDFPRLLYPSDDPLQENGPAFLKNEALPRAAQGVVLGRQGALAGGCVASGNSITNKHQLRFVTPPFMAYICCIFRFAISSETCFAVNGGQGFKYTTFYNRILKVLIGIAAVGPDGEQELNELMNWWEERIWGDNLDAGDEEEPVAEDEVATTTPDDVVAQYREHIAKKRRLADAEAAAVAAAAAAEPAAA